MGRILTAFSLAAGQLADRLILAVLGKTIAVTLGIFVLLGWAGSYALDYFLGEFAVFFGFDGAMLLTIVLTMIAAWVLFRVVALAVLQFFADDIVMAVEAKHYPDALLSARKMPFAEELSNSLKSTLRVVLVNLAVLPFAIFLLVTGIGAPLLFWAVNAFLLGRELQDMVWLRQRTDAAEAPPLSGPARFMLGGVVAALFLVPFINLLAPVLGAASATHLVHRKRNTANAR
ncbi:EI24 domain-containing protein [Altererythrobacter sp. ZODW24]|uniref:EI24 domain-containing protein n=1 Tax=Altererythrobacter sp. ZODW24 TaxID=2185142 RepID=UPI000DF805A3|nr:EI24 domain-containing protein [Altererythrobacter sp. ZODW24]